MANKRGHKRLTVFTLRLMGEIGGMIAAPVIVLTWIGRKADLLLETKPKVLGVSILLSFVISTVSLCLRAVDYGDQYEQLTDGPPKDLGDPGGPGIRGGPPDDGRFS